MLSQKEPPALQADSLSAADFYRHFIKTGQPTLIRNLQDAFGISHWSRDYLEKKIGDDTVHVNYNSNGIFSVFPDAATGPVLTSELKLSQAMGKIFSRQGRNYYAQQRSIKRNHPALLSDLARPAFMRRFNLILEQNLWIGGTGCKTPLHHDIADNLFVQISGRKRITLLPYDQKVNLHPAYQSRMPHFSTINIFDPAASRDFPSLLPARQEMMVLDVAPGHGVFIPSGWWHAVETLDASISVNFWWVDPRRLWKYVSVALPLLNGLARNKIAGH